MTQAHAGRCVPATGSGSIHVNIAESPFRDNEMLAPGKVSVHQHSDCYGTSTDDTSVVPVMGEQTGLEPLGGYWAYQDTFMGKWKLKLTAGGAWVIHQHRALSTTSHDSADETVDLAITGSLTKLKADCALPTVRRLHPATSFAAADAIVVRGGFSHLRNSRSTAAWLPRVTSSSSKASATSTPVLGNTCVSSRAWGGPPKPLSSRRGVWRGFGAGLADVAAGGARHSGASRTSPVDVVGGSAARIGDNLT
jgi:hypothetical protein